MSIKSKFLKVTFIFMEILGLLGIYVLLQLGISVMYKTIYVSMGKMSCLMIFLLVIFLILLLGSKLNKRYNLLFVPLYKNIKYYRYIAILYLFIPLSSLVIIIYQMKVTKNISSTTNQQALNNMFQNNFSGILFVITLAIFIAPLYEEFLCRYLIFTTGSVVDAPTWIVWFISIFIFVLLHTPSTVFDFLRYAFIGMIFCIAYKKYGYTGSVGLHLLNNLISILFMLFL